MNKDKYQQENWVGIGDKIFIFPFNSRKNNFKLNRNLYMIDFLPKHSYLRERNRLILPSFEDCETQLQLYLEDSSNIRSRFILEVKKGVPFRINGAYTCKAFLKKEDVIDIGYNKIRFDDYQNEEILDAYEQLSKRAVNSSLNIVIEGETGTGKTSLARKIHEESGRIGEFVHINLSSFSPSLIESELFGHVKGSFTGAFRDKMGAFLQAHHGTLFLDEIDSLPIGLQIKLLLFLDDMQIRPVGAATVRKSDVRLIFASATSLDRLLKEKKIRRDFYYRISSGFVIKLKSLRENKELIRRIIREFCIKNDVVVSQQLEKFYLNVAWLGNIRQLLGHLETKKTLSSSRMIDYDYRDKKLKYFDNPDTDYFVSEEDIIPLKVVKMQYAYHAYTYFQGSIARSSQALGITRNTMKSLIANYRL